MAHAWNSENVTIPTIAIIDLEEEPTIKGTALIWRPLVSRTDHLEWHARVTPRGWMVFVREQTGRQTMWEGPTFNLLLEVAAAIRRH